MNPPQAILGVAVCDQVVYIQVKGKADFTSSLDLRKLVNELQARGYKRFVFELCECLMMDSTFLGILSEIGLRFRGLANGNGDGPALVLCNPSRRIAEVLENLGVADLFKIEQTPVAPAETYQPVKKSTGDTQADLTRTCLEAHQTLMRIRPENARKFKDVAEFLAEDLKRLETAAPLPNGQSNPIKVN